MRECRYSAKVDGSSRHAARFTHEKFKRDEEEVYIPN